MIVGPLRFPQAFLFALVLHACVLLLVHIRPMATEPSTVRSLIIHLSAVSERAAAPVSEPQPAASSIPSSVPARAALMPERPIEPEAVEDETEPLRARAPAVSRSIESVTPRSVPKPPRHAPVENVESRRMDSAALDDSALAVPTERAAAIAAEVTAS